MEFKQLGPYLIGKRIGKGGMGSVYAAVHQQTDKQAAIKTLAPQLAIEEGFRDRFGAEIDSLKKLRHENIVQLFAYGEQDGTLFYSMELVDGTSLEEEIRAGRRFDWHETLQIGIQICRALKHAHDHGVVHRDIKPANILLAADQYIKIADFGIARLFGSTQLTTVGGVLGTADYMSPEQADGSSTTELCDQYSLGGVLYALLAGRPPFLAKTMPEMLQLQRFAKPEPVRRYASETPEPLERLLTQLLSKDPEDRFPNVLVLGRHMEAMDKALSRPVEVEPEVGERETLADSHGTVAGGASLPSNEATQAFVPSPSELYDAPTLVEQAAETEPEQPAHQWFTTVAEETRRQEELAQKASRWGSFVQGTSLIGALALLTWLGWWLMRPATADALYEEITTIITEEGTENLRKVADPLEEFIKRFADDPRVEQLQPYHEELVWQRRERAWRLKSNLTSRGESSLGENIYSKAIQISKENPARAVAMFQSLQALFDSETASEEDRHWVVLADRQLKKLRATLQKQRTARLPELQERLAVAQKLEASAPDSARRMYRAMVSLYDGQPWAAEVVEEARQRLETP